MNNPPEPVLAGRKRFKKGKQIGEGTYGRVYKAEDVVTGQPVAIKKIKQMGKSSDGIHWTALREIKILQELHHPNVVDLVEVFSHNQSINLVFEFCTTDMENVINDRNIIFTDADIKAYMRMMIQGIAACHSAWILHRDLKPNNYLVGVDNQIKLGDFGLARIFGSPGRLFTHQVVTRYYRAPELIYGATEYGVGVDMWAIGCIFAELMLRVPFFPGESDIDQLGKIYHALGTPTEENWPDMTTLPCYVAYEPREATPFKQIFSAAGADALDLLQGFLHFDPNKRLTAEQALAHEYFSNDPQPTAPDQLVTRTEAPVKKENTSPNVGLGSTINMRVF